MCFVLFFTIDSAYRDFVVTYFFRVVRKQDASKYAKYEAWQVKGNENDPKDCHSSPSVQSNQCDDSPSVKIKSARRRAQSGYGKHSGLPEVSTLAGSPEGDQDCQGTAAKFNKPQGIAISPDASFALVADHGNNRVRKIVLATSIAETSLTIEDIRVVIDGGLARRARFDPGSGMSRLVTEPVTRAEATQRAGRRCLPVPAAAATDAAAKAPCLAPGW